MATRAERFKSNEQRSGQARTQPKATAKSRTSDNHSTATTERNKTRIRAAVPLTTTQEMKRITAKSRHTMMK